MATEEPKMKKAKTDDDDSEEEEEKEVDGKEEDEGVQVLQNDNGESYVELSKMKRLTIRKFKSNILVDIREVSDCVNVCVCAVFVCH